MRSTVKNRKGVKLCTNHEPKPKLGKLILAMPPSKRRDRAEIKKRLSGSTRGTPGAFGKANRGARAPRSNTEECDG